MSKKMKRNKHTESLSLKGMGLSWEAASYDLEEMELKFPRPYVDPEPVGWL